MTPSKNHGSTKDSFVLFYMTHKCHDQYIRTFVLFYLPITATVFKAMLAEWRVR
jgi:hypothetical protein